MEMKGIEPSASRMLSARSTPELHPLGSVAGNWTRITRVTGGNTNHYTTTDFALSPDRTGDLQIFSLTLSRLSYQGDVSLTGVEPVIFPLGGGRLIHWAIETKLENRTLEFFSAPRRLRDLSVHSLSHLCGNGHECRRSTSELQPR